MKNIILTGDRPSGKLHIGHYVGSLKRRVELQNSGKFDKIYISDIENKMYMILTNIPFKSYFARVTDL